MGPYGEIKLPTSIDTWDKQNEFFPAGGLTSTRTFIYDHPDKPGLRVAFGSQNVGAWFFFVEMKPDQEQSFVTFFRTWRANQQGTHELVLLYEKKPPPCGTPNTGACPPDPLPGAITALAEHIAGAGASDAEIDAARAQIATLLLGTISGAYALVD